MRTVKILAVAFMAALGLGIMVAPANASLSDCTSGRFCLWTGNGTGTRGEYLPAVDHCLNISGTLNNNAESGRNRTASTFYTYNGANCTGVSGSWGPGAPGGPTSAEQFNQISSIYRA